MRISLLLVFVILINYSTLSQCEGRYINEIFNNVSKTSVNYSDVYNDSYHTMDVYSPVGDSETNRPLIIFMHGGSFYGGDKDEIDCQHFCESFAKKGYVTASLNYRLVGFLDIVNFLTYNATQYEVVLKAVADAKSAIRFFRKDYYENGNSYGIDPNTIFAGGTSAGAVIAIHLAYIDHINDLPVIPINVQNIVNSFGGLEGDAGNVGYSSHVNGVISFAGGINDVDWIDSYDEPLVSCQGDNDLTVNYNCGPGLNQSTVLTLCGSGEMHPKADEVGVNNSHLLFPGEAHSWFLSGNGNPLFVQALDFTTNFLYPLLPCNTTYISAISKEKILVKSVDILGRDINEKNKNNIHLLIYSDGSVEKKMKLK